MPTDPTAVEPGPAGAAWTYPAMPALDEPPAADRWLRLDPRSIATFPFAQGAGVLLALVVAALAGGSMDRLYIRLGGEVGLFVAVGALRWWRFQYRVLGDRLETRSGLFGRQTKAINVDRIRGVDIEAKMAHRVLGVCALRIEHPGAASGGHGRNRDHRDRIDAVSRAEAERLRNLLLHERAVRADGPDASVAPARAERVLFALPARWLLYAPFSVRMLVAGPVAIGAFINYSNDANIDFSHLASSLARGVSWSVALVAAVVLIVALAVAGAVIAYWGWTVTARADDVVITRGLLTRRTTAIERRRLRGVVLKEPLLGRPAHAASLAVELSGVSGGSHAALVPLGPVGALTRFGDEFVAPCAVALSGHPVGARRRRRRRAAVPGVVLAVAGLCLLLRDAPLGYVLLGASVALALAGFAWAQASYRALGHAVDERVVTARHGVLERRTQTVDRRAPIGLRVRQSVFARRAGVASMDVALVSRGYTRICDMAAGDVDELARTLLPGWSPPPPPKRRDHGNGGQN